MSNEDFQKDLSEKANEPSKSITRHEYQAQNSLFSIDVLAPSVVRMTWNCLMLVHFVDPSSLE